MLSIKHLHHLCRWGSAPLLFLVVSLAGCADNPYSQRRIQKRNEHRQQTWRAIEKHEKDAATKFRSRMVELDRWWKSDEARTRENIEKAGDYFW